MVIIAGHTRLMAARKLELGSVPIHVADGLTDQQVKAYRIADNKVAEIAEWDTDLLSLELLDLKDADFDLGLLGFDSSELDLYLGDTELIEGETDPDEVPDVQEDVISKPGDIWILGNNRLMCGDSTIVTDVERLMNGRTAQLLHADPPYGMGKEADGIANDNLYGEKLDKFQVQWWATFYTFLADNASAYIWGNAPDLWRLWHAGDLCDSERLELRNEIVWDKKNIPGMASPALTQYPVATERCLFIQFGTQFLGNVNANDFPESWEPIRAYMEAEAKGARIKPGDIRRVCGCSMYSHWFTKSQFTLIPEKHYLSLANEYPGCFERPWCELKAEWDRVKTNPTGEVQSARSYFDNAHEAMRDVWEFSRVIGDERHGHATPKPVDMIARIMKSSAKKGWLCVEPFSGSGTTIIAAEQTGRHCYAMEISEAYVDLAVRRFQEFTGQNAVLDGDGRTFNEISEAAVNG
jgi:DNA modification methylase